MKPELATRIDVYALGVLAFELLTGDHPFDAKSIPGLLQQHAYTPATAPSKVRDDLPAAFDQAVLHALAKDPRERTASAAEFRRELLEAVQAAEDFPEDLEILTVTCPKGEERSCARHSAVTRRRPRFRSSCSRVRVVPPHWHHLRGIGIDRFLRTPVDFDTLEAAVWSLCRER